MKAPYARRSYKYIYTHRRFNRLGLETDRANFGRNENRVHRSASAPYRPAAAGPSVPPHGFSGLVGARIYAVPSLRFYRVGPPRRTSTTDGR